MNSPLVEIAKDRFSKPINSIIPFVNDDKANVLLNDLDNYPHAFVLACIMDRQIKAEKAWMIPYRIKMIIGGFSIYELATVSLDEYKKIFNDYTLHRYNEKMAEAFFSAVQNIENYYNGDVSQIWMGKPSSATVVYKFLQFKGVGIKIATMAANILARQFKIPFSDYYSIDISPDVHIRRVMSRMGLVPAKAPTEMIIYKAREIYPVFPGIIDYSLWEIGRTWCFANKKPNCKECIVKDSCEKKYN